MRPTGTDRCEFEDEAREAGVDPELCPYPAVGEAEVWWSPDPIKVCACHMDDAKYMAAKMREPRAFTREEMGV